MQTLIKETTTFLQHRLIDVYEIVALRTVLYIVLFTPHVSSDMIIYFK